MTKEDNYTIHITENPVEVIIEQDFFNISQQCRESYYYLVSLENLFTTHVCTQKDYDKEYLDNTTEKIQKLKKEFKESDKKILDSPIIEYVNSVPQRGLDVKDLIDLLIEHINLKSKIDELQCEILGHLINIDKHLIEGASQKIPSMSQFTTQFHLDILMESAFSKSPDEDKIINYCIKTNDKTIEEECRKIEYEIPIRLEVRDSTFLLSKNRRLYKHSRKILIDTIVNIPKFKEKGFLNEINIKQYQLNRKVTKLTIIVVLIGILSLFSSILGNYFLYKSINMVTKDDTEKTQYPTSYEYIQNHDSVSIGDNPVKFDTVSNFLTNPHGDGIIHKNRSRKR